MKSKWLKWGLFIVLILLCGDIVSEFFYFSKFSQAKQVIEKVEQYKIKNNQYPADLSLLGYEVKEEGPIYYEKINNSRYIIWFGTTVGESKVYDPRYNKWFNYVPK